MRVRVHNKRSIELVARLEGFGLLYLHRIGFDSSKLLEDCVS